MSLGFPDSSVGKESTRNAGDPSLISGSGRSAGEGIGYPLQYSWASLVAQLVENPPAMQETWVWSLDWEDPLQKGEVTHSNTLAWRIPWPVYSPWGRKESDTTEQPALLRYYSNTQGLVFYTTAFDKFRALSLYIILFNLGQCSPTWPSYLF